MLNPNTNMKKKDPRCEWCGKEDCDMSCWKPIFVKDEKLNDKYTDIAKQAFDKGFSSGIARAIECGMGLKGKHDYLNMDGHIAKENPFNNGWDMAIQEILDALTKLTNKPI